MLCIWLLSLLRGEKMSLVTKYYALFKKFAITDEKFTQNVWYIPSQFLHLAQHSHFCHGWKSPTSALLSDLPCCHERKWIRSFSLPPLKAGQAIITKNTRACTRAGRYWNFADDIIVWVEYHNTNNYCCYYIVLCQYHNERRCGYKGGLI